ncbi:MAG: tetratricopeptide repeat protein, partial [Candidatus Binatia bacterium]
FATLQRMAAEMSQRPEPRRVVSNVPDRQPQGGRNEAACRRATPYFYRAADTTKLREKVTLYRQGLRICPASARAHFELADAYTRLGEPRQAAAELRAVLQYDPDYPGARRRLHELETRLSRR